MQEHLTTDELELLSSSSESELNELLGLISRLDSEPLAANVLGQVQKSRYTTNDKRDVAAFFDVSIDTINLWQSKGMPYQSGGKGVRGSYDFRECAQWLAEQKAGVSQDDSGKQSADASYREEKARIVELQRRQLEGELVSVDEYRENTMRALVLIRKGVENFRRAFGNDGVAMLCDILDEVEDTLFGRNKNA